MTGPAELIEAFQGLDGAEQGELGDLDQRRQVFSVLRTAGDELGESALTPAEVSTVLRDVYGVALPRQRIEALLAAEPGTVARRKVGGRRAYQLMAAGRREVEAATDAALFIDPDKGFSGLREAHVLLGNLTGDVRVCDPYADAKTLDMLANCEKADSIRLLTQKVKAPDGFKQAVKAFEREHGRQLEVRKAPGGVLHDRYAIHDGGMLMFGTSLNGLGLKQSFVVSLGPDLRSAALAAFETTWDDGTDL